MPSPVIGTGEAMVNRTDKISALVECMFSWEHTFKKQTNTFSLLVLIIARKERKKGLGWRVTAISAEAIRKSLSAEETFELIIEWPEDGPHCMPQTEITWAEGSGKAFRSRWGLAG